MGIEALIRGEMTVRPLQELHAALRATQRSEARDGVPAVRPAGAVPARRRRRRGGARVDAAAAGAVSRRPAAVTALARGQPGRRRRAAEVFGVRLPQPGRAGRRDGQGRRGRCPPGRRSASASSRSAPSPRTPQPGNDRPRLFRLPDSAGGDQPDGLQQRRRRRAGRAGWRALGPLPVPLGISLGKSKVTPLDEAVDDYLTSLRLLTAVRRLLRGQRQLAEHARACAPCRTRTS